MFTKFKRKLKRIYYDNKKVILHETFYIGQTNDGDCGKIVDIFHRFRLKILSVQYVEPSEGTNYLPAIRFVVCGRTKDACMYENYINRHFKPFDPCENVCVYEPGVELT